MVTLRRRSGGLAAAAILQQQRRCDGGFVIAEAFFEISSGKKLCDSSECSGDEAFCDEANGGGGDALLPTDLALVDGSLVGPSRALSSEFAVAGKSIRLAVLSLESLGDDVLTGSYRRRWSRVEMRE